MSPAVPGCIVWTRKWRRPAPSPAPGLRTQMNWQFLEGHLDLVISYHLIALNIQVPWAIDDVIAIRHIALPKALV